jgi:hypothetical protein
MNYQVILNFNDIEQIQEYFQDQKEFEQYKMKKQMKKEQDHRGGHMREHHQKAKSYHQDHPELSYKECLKLIKTNK